MLWLSNMVCTNTNIKCKRSPVDSILRLMTVWKVTGKIIGTVIIVTYARP